MVEKDKNLEETLEGNGLDVILVGSVDSSKYDTKREMQILDEYRPEYLLVMGMSHPEIKNSPLNKLVLYARRLNITMADPDISTGTNRLYEKLSNKTQVEKTRYLLSDESSKTIEETESDREKTITDVILDYTHKRKDPNKPIIVVLDVFSAYDFSRTDTIYSSYYSGYLGTKRGTSYIPRTLKEAGVRLKYEGINGDKLCADTAKSILASFCVAAGLTKKYWQ